MKSGGQGQKCHKAHARAAGRVAYAYRRCQLAHDRAEGYLPPSVRMCPPMPDHAGDWWRTVAIARRTGRLDRGGWLIRSWSRRCSSFHAPPGVQRLHMLRNSRA